MAFRARKLFGTFKKQATGFNCERDAMNVWSFVCFSASLLEDLLKVRRFSVSTKKLRFELISCDEV